MKVQRMRSSLGLEVLTSIALWADSESSLNSAESFAALLRHAQSE